MDEHSLTLFNMQTASEKDKEKMASKLHTQFGHATCDRIMQLIKDAGIEDKVFESKLNISGIRNLSQDL